VPSAHFGIRALRGTFNAQRDTLPRLSAAADRLDKLLASWDGRAEVDSVPMTVAFYLNRLLPGGIPDPVVRVSDDPAADPEIREPTEGQDGGAYGRALEAVADLLQRTYGTLEKPWGEVHVIARPDGDFGVPGGCSALRALAGMWRGWWDEDDLLDSDGIERCDFGSRTLRLTELGPDGASVRSLSITGQVPAYEHPNSPHVLDQARLYSQLELKRLPLTREEIEAGARTEDHVSCNHDAIESITWTTPNELHESAASDR